MGVLRRAVAATLLLGCAATAQAHVSVTPAAATAGSYQVLRFGVGHGCEGRATTAVRVEIPEGVASARPQPKPGWTLQVERAPGGEAVQAITWRGELPADQFDEFLLQVHLPAAPGPLGFPVVQSCGGAEVRWTGPADAAGEGPRRPMPIVTLAPDGAEASPPHHH